MGRHYNIPVFIPHAGCPNDCIFCNQRKISGQIKMPALDETETIIRSCLETGKTGYSCEIAFFGGSFTGLPMEEQKNYLELAGRYVKEGKVSGIRISTRPDYIDDDILSIVKEYPVKVIELGIQSLDDAVLKRSYRGYSADRAIHACRLVKKYGFSLGVQVMIGLPEDSLEKSIRTTEKIIFEKPDMVRIYPTLVIRDTRLEKEYINGNYRSLSLDEAVLWCSRLIPLYEAAGIKVLRIGLMHTENIQMGKDVLAGPVHPAFGELVYSKIWLNRVIKILEAKGKITHQKLLIHVPSSKISTVTGQHSANIKYLKKCYGFSDIMVLGDRMEENSLMIESRE